MIPENKRGGDLKRQMRNFFGKRHLANKRKYETQITHRIETGRGRGLEKGPPVVCDRCHAKPSAGDRSLCKNVLGGSDAIIQWNDKRSASYPQHRQRRSPPSARPAPQQTKALRRPPRAALAREREEEKGKGGRPAYSPGRLKMTAPMSADEIADETREAAACGDIDTVRRALKLIPSHPQFWYYACGEAARANHPAIVRLVADALCSAWELSWAMGEAVEAGRRPIAEFLWSRIATRFEPVLASFVLGAAMKRGLSDIEWLVDVCGADAIVAGIRDDDDVWLFVADASLDAIERVCALIAHVPERLKDFMGAAARAGRIDIVRHLCTTGLCVPDADIVYAATESGNEYVLDYLRRTGADVPQESYRRAISLRVGANAQWALGHCDGPCCAPSR